MDSVLKGTLRPLGDRIIVKPEVVDPDKETKSGLIIPTENKEKPLTGIVVAVGPGKRNAKGEVIPISEHIKVGLKVYFGKYTGVEVKQEDGDIIILHEDEIYGVVEDDKG